MIDGNEYDFRRTYKAKWKWPREKFANAGRKLKIGEITSLPYQITPQHAAMLLWCNGGVPAKNIYSSKKHYFEVREFLGFGTNWDLTDTILRFRDCLPRYSVPVALLDDGGLGDLAFLLTFPGCRDERENKVWYFTWFHEGDPEDPNDPRMLIEVAPTLKQFVDGLRESPLKNRTPPG